MKYDSDIVTITNSAKTYLTNAMKNHGKDNVMLAIDSGGCNGFTYNWEFTDDVPDGDDITCLGHTERQSPRRKTDLNLIIDKASEMFLFGSEIDFNSNTYERITIDLSEYGTAEESKGAWAFIKEKYWDKIDVLYNGNTGPPPREAGNFPEYFYRSRSKEALKKYKKFKMPFIEFDKRHTVWMADYFALNNIIKYSHTCTAWAQGSCGECWQCKERQWGFKSHGYIDTGIR